MLKLQSLVSGYSEALHNPLNIEVKKGTLNLFLGPNGSGKSTLLKTILGLVSPLQGEVQAQGRMSAVFPSSPMIARLPVRQFLAWNRYSYTHFFQNLDAAGWRLQEELVEKMQIGPFLNRFFHELSDGERQRVRIAGALMQEPSILIMDEPTAFLDLAHRASLLAELLCLAREKKMLVLLSLHDLELALKFADTLWVHSSAGSIQVAAPEQLVLQGVIGETFDSRAAAFDPMLGTFRLGGSRFGFKIRVEGSLLTRVWLKRAVTRMGGEVVADASVCLGADDTGFYLRYGQQESTSTDLHELMLELAQRLQA